MTFFMHALCTCMLAISASKGRKCASVLCTPQAPPLVLLWQCRSVFIRREGVAHGGVPTCFGGACSYKRVVPQG